MIAIYVCMYSAEFGDRYVYMLYIYIYIDIYYISTDCRSAETCSVSVYILQSFGTSLYIYIYIYIYLHLKIPKSKYSFSLNHNS